MPDKPVVDVRTYTIRPRGVTEFIRQFEELALPIIIKHWGPPSPSMFPRSGLSIRVIHVWE